MEFYIVNDENIKLSNKISHQDIIFILDGKAGYIWKGKQARNLDEDMVNKMVQLITNKFIDIKFGLIPSLEISEIDNPKNIQIKTEISQRLPSLIKEKIKGKKTSFFQGLGKKIREFKEYENSREWRKKLSNLSNIWKLSIFNIIVVSICIIILFDSLYFHLFFGDFNLLLILGSCLAIVVLANLIFIIFPMRFPTKILNIGDGDMTRKNLPPQPIVPEKKTSISKGEVKRKTKTIVKQIPIAPLIVPKKKKKSILKDKKAEKDNGVDYLSEEDMDLDIPLIPESPKKKDKITIDSPGLSTKLLETIKSMESKDIKAVIVNCERCKEVIPVPIKKDAVLKSELPVVPISYFHKNPKGKDLHCITLHLDHDFDIRRQRISDVVLSFD